MTIRRTRFAATAAIFIAVLFIAAALLLALPKHAISSGGTPITGYLWSDTIGWISMSGSSYGVTIDPSTGILSGDGWSDNIGWVSANAADTSTCGSVATIASNGTMTGWLRALGGGTAQSGGWDGCISLNGSGYGATLASNGTFSGFAWGDTNVGWVDFEYATTTYGTVCTYTCTGAGNQTITPSPSTCGAPTTCVSPYYCRPGSSACLIPQIIVNPGGNLTVVPDVVQNDETATVSWNISNATCSVSGTNGDGTAGSTDPNSPGVWSASSGSETTSGITAQTIYTLSCTGEGASPSNLSQTATVNVAPQFQEK